MKHFYRDGKVNFVDENNVFLGYDMEQSCCEDADWFIDDSPQYIRIHRDDSDLDLTDYVFDKDFFDEHCGEDFDAGGIVIFKIVSPKQVKYIHLYNCHNGYYGHGFSFSVNGAVTIEETL